MLEIASTYNVKVEDLAKESGLIFDD